MNQELVPNDALPDDFIRAIKHSDYSSVSEFIFFFFFFFNTFNLYCVPDLE